VTAAGRGIYHIVGLVKNYGNSALQNFTGEAKTTYFKQCSSANNNFYIGTSRMDWRISCVNYISIKFAKQNKIFAKSELQYLHPKIAL